MSQNPEKFLLESQLEFEKLTKVFFKQIGLRKYQDAFEVAQAFFVVHQDLRVSLSDVSAKVLRTCRFRENIGIEFFLVFIFRGRRSLSFGFVNDCGLHESLLEIPFYEGSVAGLCVCFDDCGITI